MRERERERERESARARAKEGERDVAHVTARGLSIMDPIQVREALGHSQTQDVLVCVCHLCAKLGVKCFLQRRPDDGLVFFGSALVFAGRVEVRASQVAASAGDEEREGGEGAEDASEGEREGAREC